MISVGIDISKEKSTICILKEYSEIVKSPYEIKHTESELEKLANLLNEYDDEVKIVMEATGSYHLPVLMYLINKDFYVSVINPLLMKKYATNTLRKGKTDKLDSIKIANYGIDNWYKLTKFRSTDEAYSTLKILSRQYNHYIKMRIESILSLTTLLDATMPEIKKLIHNNSKDNGSSKLCDFAEKYIHYDNITKMSEDEFKDDFLIWAIEKGYHRNVRKAEEIYALAQDSIPVMSSKSPSTKIMILESVRVLNEINKPLATILAEMSELAKTLDEFSVVREMNGVGDKLAPRLIAEIGDVRRFYSGKALVAYAGLDAPPHQSGNFVGTNRHISKRGSKYIRKTGYEVMKCLKTAKPVDDGVYAFIIKKESEGKPLKVAKIAGLNKFLRIYYAKVMEVYS